MTHKHQHKPTDNQVPPESPTPQHRREEIETLAYAFYCQCGFEHGHDLEHWVEAERWVLERYQERHTTDG